jgi:acyl carrier protein
MAVETIVEPATTKPFPTVDVEAKLRDLLLDGVMADAELKGIALPADKPGKFSASIRLDSLGVVDLLCGLEPVVGFELKENLVKAGGYKSINDAVEHLMPRIEKAWTKNGITGGKK